MFASVTLHVTKRVTMNIHTFKALKSICTASGIH